MIHVNGVNQQLRTVGTSWCMFLSQYSENERAHKVFGGSCSFSLPNHACLFPDMGHEQII